MLYFPKFFDNVLPVHMQKKYPGLRKTLSGSVIATFEIFIITPLERLKVYIMTNYHKKDRVKSMFKYKNKFQQFNSLFHGLSG